MGSGRGSLGEINQIVEGRKIKGIFQLQRAEHKPLILQRVKAAKRKNISTQEDAAVVLKQCIPAAKPALRRTTYHITEPADTPGHQLSGCPSSPLNNRSQKVGTTCILPPRKDHTGGS